MNNQSSKLITVLALIAVNIALVVFVNSHMSSDSSGSSDVEQATDVIESITGVPAKIVTEAAASGGIKAFLFGSEAEKHLFAKGKRTQFGRMKLNADDYLKHSRGWSEAKIHQIGHKYGFSKEWAKR